MKGKRLVRRSDGSLETRKNVRGHQELLRILDYLEEKFPTMVRVKVAPARDLYIVMVDTTDRELVRDFLAPMVAGFKLHSLRVKRWRELYIQDRMEGSWFLGTGHAALALKSYYPLIEQWDMQDPSAETDMLDGGVVLPGDRLRPMLERTINAALTPFSNGWHRTDTVTGRFKS